MMTTTPTISASRAPVRRRKPARLQLPRLHSNTEAATTDLAEAAKAIARFTPDPEPPPAPVIHRRSSTFFD